MIKKILLVLLLALIVLQFIHPKKNKAEGVQPNYVGNKYAVPQDVNAILVKACNDCHSNNTSYPWYSKLQPIDWWMDGHVRDGKKELKLDEYTNRSLRFQYHKLEGLAEQVEKGEMPLDSYTWIHKDAILKADQKKKLTDWATSIMDTMRAQYPPDSLIRKK